jgi:hypothetical protein
LLKPKKSLSYELMNNSIININHVTKFRLTDRRTDASRVGAL